MRYKELFITPNRVQLGLTAAKEVFKLKKGDRLVITGGIINEESGNTNLIKLETI